MEAMEDEMTGMYSIVADIDTVIHAIGDSVHNYDEDELLNMLIGMRQLHTTRYERMWQTWENKYNNENNNGT